MITLRTAPLCFILIHFVFFLAFSNALALETKTGFTGQIEHQAASGPASRERFSFHIPNEPKDLDPALVEGNDSQYLLNTLYRGLYWYDNERGLVAVGAKKCIWQSTLRLDCELNPTFFWSDGKVVAAEDYVYAIKKILAKNSKSLAQSLLANLKNSSQVFKNPSLINEIGVSSPKKNHLVFEFSKPDPDFQYKLTSPLLSPQRPDQEFGKEQTKKIYLSTGPYILDRWEAHKRIYLKPNLHYLFKNQEPRPDVEIFFVDEDNTALQLYEAGTLKWLRRLPTVFFEKYQASSDFHLIPIARFDYVGFGEELKNQPRLREALSLSLNYDELAKLYHARGRPGCIGLENSLLESPVCYSYDVERAKNIFAELPQEIQKKRLVFKFSKLGGDDIKKGVEWMQQQWRRNLGLTIDLEQVEQGLYLNELSQHAPAIFRKGVGLEAPTCFAALENFRTKAPENYIHYDNDTFNGLVATILEKSVTKTAAKSLNIPCTKATRLLLQEHVLIPMGQVHFALLASTYFKGWKLNHLNQLDLSNLSRVSHSSKR